MPWGERRKKDKIITRNEVNGKKQNHTIHFCFCVLAFTHSKRKILILFLFFFKCLICGVGAHQRIPNLKNAIVASIVASKFKNKRVKTSRLQSKRQTSEQFPPVMKVVCIGATENPSTTPWRPIFILRDYSSFPKKYIYKNIHLKPGKIEATMRINRLPNA